MKILRGCSALLITLALMFIMQINVKAVTIADEWQKQTGVADTDFFYDTIETPDGGYLSVGYTESVFPGAQTPWLVKVSVTGQIEWTKTYDSTTPATLYSIEATADGKYIASGQGTYGDGVLLKIDQDGNIEWSSRTQANSFNGVKQTADGGYIASGQGVDGTSLLNKFDENGSFEWVKTYGNAYESFNSVFETSDGDFIATDTTKILKVDQNGNQIWIQEDVNGITEMKEMSDGNYILVGLVGEESFITKIDENGNELWKKTYGDVGVDLLYSIDITSDGGFIAAGETTSNFNGNTLSYYGGWFIKVDANGNLQWSHVYPDERNYTLNSVIETSTGDYVASGYSDNTTDSYSDGWIIKVKATYEVSFNANGGQGSMAAQNISYLDSMSLSDNAFIKEGYTFKGWATTQANADNGVVTYQDKASYQQEVTEDVILYAVWIENSSKSTTSDSNDDITAVQTGLPQTGNEILMYAGIFMTLALGMIVPVLRRNNSC